jgi:hypothetical protein
MVYYLALLLINHEPPVKEEKERMNINEHAGTRSRSKIVGIKTKKILRYLSYQILLLIVSIYY